MITILPVRQKVQNKISKFGLVRKFEKQIKLLTVNPKHPSLNLELLEPKRHGIYSFRIDRKYRALFFVSQKCDGY